MARYWRAPRACHADARRPAQNDRVSAAANPEWYAAHDAGYTDPVAQTIGSSPGNHSGRFAWECLKESQHITNSAGRGGNKCPYG